MKFRHFEFRLFPKIKSKKKKKSKFCNSDFPRDIGLDKNFNYSKSTFHGYYDNIAADTFSEFRVDNLNDIRYRDAQTYGGRYDFACYKTYPLPELKIQVDGTCDCPDCFEIGFNANPQPPLLLGVDGAYATQIGTPVGTPNTIPRTRTRIKTNPWLPSPRTTPSPSPTETVNSIVFSSAEFGSTGRHLSEIYRREGNRYQDNIPSFKSDCLLSYSPSDRGTSTLHGLVKIAELDDEFQYEGFRESHESELTELCETRRKSIECLTLNLREDLNDEYLDSIDKRHKRFSYTDFLKNDTDDSNVNSPVIETFDLFNCINHEIDFGYEEDADDLLENAGLPRDDTFMSVKELLNDTDGEEKSHISLNNNYHVFEMNETKQSQNQNEASHETNTDLDDEKDESSEKLINRKSDANMDVNFYDEAKMQDSIDTGYASVSPEADSLSSDDENELYMSDGNRSLDTEPEVEKSPQDELEWDDDPTTQMLFDFSLSANDSSRSFKTECECRRKRSRSLADIELSLDEKVTRLREEKVFVQRKIKEAIEEERIRQEQLIFYQSVAPDNRKEALLQTLCDLKTRLENQSSRLQTSYDTVLALQRSFSQRRRRTLPHLETDI